MRVAVAPSALCQSAPGTGEHAYRTEQAVLSDLHDLGVRHHLTADLMPQGGHTETFDDHEVAAETLRRMAATHHAETSH